MVIQKTIGGVSLFCESTVPKSIPKKFREAKFLYIKSGTLSQLSRSDKIAIPPTEEGIDVYLDKKSGDLYLTNFVYDQALLHHPINAISVFTDRIEIYLNEKNLDIPFHQTSRTLQTEIAFSELFLQDQTDERPKPKRRRLSKESQQDKKFTDTPIKGLSSSMSTELGVRTFQESPSSQSDFQPAHINSEFQTQESGEDSDDSIVPETEFSACSQQDDTVGMNAMGSGSDDSMLSGIGLSFSNKTLSDFNLKKKTFGEFPKSCLDQKTLKDQQVSIFAETLNDLLTKDKISEKEIIVSTAQLQLSQELEEEDVIIQRFTKELEESSEIKKFDPIVVIKNENYYNVISGTRRVAAYKSMQINKINVSEINAADGSKYRSCCFFRNMEKKKRRITVWYGVNLYKHGRELEDEITKLSLAGLQISTRVLRTIFIKYKVNPKETILLLRKAWETENELRNELSRVIPCARYILTEKKIEEYAINGLIEMFGNEPEFIDFVRKTDMRGITSSKQLHLLKAKYESHKEQSRSSSSRKTSKSTNINVSTIDVAHFEVLITANSINAQSIVSKKNTLLVLLIGQRIEKINQSILMLPDALGIPDEFGRINNHISVTILIKKEGHILNAFDTSDFLSSRGMPNRTVFSTDQLRQLASTFTKYYIDFGGALKADLITHLLTPSTTVFVSKTFYQNQLEKCMKEPGSDNTMQ